MINEELSEKIKKEMLEYEKETGKKAIWRDSITERFKKWQRGEEIYGVDKKGISILVSGEIKSKWQKFANEHSFKTISKLIRKSVDFYMDQGIQQKPINNINRLSHDLKEPLTVIQGYSKLIIDNDKEEIKPDILLKIKEIYEQSLSLENKINNIITTFESESQIYDILVIEDEISAFKVLREYFKTKEITCMGVNSGSKGLQELNRNIPNLVLLDIILPDMNGFDICKKIKSNEKTKNIPVFYITAIPEQEVRKRLEDTGADGYILKPFKFDRFDIIIDLVQS